MRPYQLGLVASLAAALLAAAWWAVGSAGGGSSVLGGPVHGAGLSPTPEVDLAARVAEGAEESQREDGERRGLGPLPAAETPADAASGAEDAILVGRLVDGFGDGVAGAEVFAATGFAWVRMPLSMETEGLDAAWLKRATTQADDAGHFAFRDTLETGSLRLEARAPGFAPRALENLKLSERRPHDLGDLVLRPGITLEGKVVDRRGQAIAGVDILQAIERGVGGMRISVPGRGVPLTTTDDEGRFVVDTLADGPWRLILDAPGYQVREETGRTQGAGEKQRGLLFVLERGEQIRGSVLELPSGMAGRLRVEARVQVRDRGRAPTGESQPAQSAIAGAVVRRVRRAALDQAGSFVVGGLAPGVQHVLTVWERREKEPELEPGQLPQDPPAAPIVSWERLSAVESAEAWPGTAGLELRFRSESALLVQVVDGGTGEPVEDFVMWAGLGRRMSALKAEDGGDVLRHHPEGRARYGGLRPPRDGARAKLRIRAAGYHDHEREGLSLARAQELDLGTVTLERAPVVRVTVLDDASGEPVAGARVLLAPEGEGSLQAYLASDSEPWGDARVRFGRTDEAGLAIVPAIEGTMSKLAATSPDHVAAEPVDVLVRGATDHEHTLRLKAGGAVVVRVEGPGGEPLTGARIEHRFLDGGEAARSREASFGWNTEVPTTDPAGVLRFEHLEPGEHAFKLAPDRPGGMIQFQRSNDRTSEIGWEHVRVADGVEQTLTLVGEARGSLSGVVTEARLPLAGANLRLEPREGSNRGQWWGWMPGGDKYGALSAHDGRYAFEQVACGEYVLTVHHGERTMTHSVEVTVAPGGTVLDVELTLAILEGRVTDAEGLPLEGVRVQVSADGQRRSYGMGGEITLVEDDKGRLNPDWRGFGGGQRSANRTNARGEYSVRGVVTDAPLRVSVSHRFVVADALTGLEISPDEIRGGVDFVLERAGELRVELAGNTGGNLRVSATLEAGEGEESGESGRARQQQRRSTGVWGGRAATLSSCRPGTWRIEVQRRVDRAYVTVAEGTAESRAGERTTVTIRVP